MIKLNFEYVWIGPRGAELDVHLVASEFAPMLSTHDHQGRRALWIDHHQPSNCFAAESSLDLGVGWQMMAATKTEIKKGTVLACTRCSTVIMHIYEVICNAYAMYLFAVYVCLEKPHQKDDARTAGTSFFFNQVKRRLVRDLAMTSLLTGVQLVKPNETLISSHINIRLVGFKIRTPAKFPTTPLN